jgi:hypothetical protein
LPHGQLTKAELLLLLVRDPTKELAALLIDAALDDASAAWLESALDAAPPTRVEKTVVDPMVEVSEEPFDTMTETRAEVVTALTGIEVAPTTPPTPKRVVVPVLVIVEDPLVTTVVKVDVAMALPMPEEAP